MGSILAARQAGYRPKAISTTPDMPSIPTRGLRVCCCFLEVADLGSGERAGITDTLTHGPNIPCLVGVFVLASLAGRGNVNRSCSVL